MDKGGKIIFTIAITALLLLAIFAFAVKASTNVRPAPNTMIWRALDAGVDCTMHQVSFDGFRMYCVERPKEVAPVPVLVKPAKK